MTTKRGAARALLGSVLVLLGLLAPEGRAQPAAAERPNILWISIEDLSPHFGAYGDEVARTPNVDRLAREGLRFTRAFTTAGVCAPSRAAIITGMYQTSIGAHHMRTRTHEGVGLPPPYEAVPPPYVKAFPEYLRAAGYYTTNNVKTDYQIGQPATIWDESSRQAHWRNRPDPDQPFFSVFNFTTTHESQNWTEPEETDPAAVEVPPYYPDTPVVRRNLARQYDNVARVDEQIGEVLRQLEEDGLADNTIVFFWSDHGDGLPRAKRWLYDSGLHVPLIVRWPGGLAPGSVNDELVSFIDLAPTVLSLAGVDVPAHMQGRVLLGPEAAPAPDYVFAARDRFDESYDMVRAVRDERYKYIRNYYPLQPYVLWVPYRNRNPIMQELLRLDAEGTLEGPPALWMRDTRPAEELYDIQADPHEVHNLAEDPAYGEVLARMRAVLDRWRVETGDMGDVPETEMVLRMWPGGEQPVTNTPLFVPNAPENRGAEASEGGTFTGPMTVALHDATQGASITYTTEPGDGARWLLYTGPIRLPEGVTTLRAKAVRYGYKESPEAVATFAVREAGSN